MQEASVGAKCKGPSFLSEYESNSWFLSSPSLKLAGQKIVNIEIISSKCCFDSNYMNELDVGL